MVYSKFYISDNPSIIKPARMIGLLLCAFTLFDDSSLK